MPDLSPRPTAQRLRAGGRTGPVLLLLHGLGATADVWDGLVAEAERRWPGRWLAPDLPGHGGSAPLPEYTFPAMAAAVADGLREAEALGDAPVVVLGHSLGGVLALELASGRYRLPVGRAVGLGIKVAWTGEELDRAAALARRPPAIFATEAEALARHVKVAGLAELVSPDDARARAGVVPAAAADGGWRLALDPRAFGVGAPDMPALLAAARCPVLLAAGENDPMSKPAQLRALQPSAVTLPGLGHNAHVEDPAVAYRLVGTWQDSPDGIG